MKTNFKILGFLFLIFCCCQNLAAQRKKKTTTIIGFLYGTEFLTTYQQDHRFSNQFGFYSDFKNNYRFSFSTSLFYAQRNFETSPFRDKIREDAITAEFFIKWNFQIRRFKFYIGAGFFERFSLRLIGGKNIPDSPFPIISFSIDEPKINEKNLGSLAGYVIGGGFNWRFSKNVIFSPQFGFNSISSIGSRDKNLSSKTAINNIFLKFRCGYRFSK